MLNRFFRQKRNNSASRHFSEKKNGKNSKIKSLWGPFLLAKKGHAQAKTESYVVSDITNNFEILAKQSKLERLDLSKAIGIAAPPTKRTYFRFNIKTELQQECRFETDVQSL